MKNSEKTKEQLSKEIDQLKVKITELEKTKSNHKKAKESLIFEKEFSHKIIETSSAIIVGLDKDHLIRIFNKGAEKITGYKKSEVIGKDWFDIFFPAEIIDEMNKVWKDLWGITSYSYINDILTKTSEKRIISWQVTGMYEEDDIIKHLSLSIGEDITERKQAEEKIKHLNLVLHAIRNVNQLIITEKNRDILIQKVCNILIEDRGYGNAWIVLLGKQKEYITSAEAGLGKSFIPMRKMLEEGTLTNCGNSTLKKKDLVITKDPQKECINCPLSANYSGQSRYSICLSHNDNIYGLLSVAASRHYIDDKEEQGLFKEVARDIAFALYSIEMEEERKQAEEKIKHLNLVLHAIRNVNQLIITEKNRDILIQKVCNILIEDRGYGNAWIVLLDKQKEYITSAEAGLGKSFIPMRKMLEEGTLTNCGNSTLKKKDLVITKDPQKECINCPLSANYSGQSSYSICLSHNDNIYGLLSVAASRHYVDDKEEQGLFKEVARDIAFALYSIEMEEERKQAEEKLLFLSSITEQVTDSIVVTDLNYRITYINQATEKLFGYSPKELKGKTPEILNADPDVKQIQENIYNTVFSKKVWQGAHLNRKKDGSTFICEFKISPFKDEQGKISSYIAIQRDITKRKQAEEKLKESEEKYRLIVENANDGIEITQEDKIIFANRQFAEMLGYKSDELKNIPFSQIYTEQAISDLNDRHKKREAGMVVLRQYETTFKKKDGTVIDVDIKYEIINYKQEPATFAIINDITDRKKTEKKLAKYRDRLEELVKERTKELEEIQKQLIRKERLAVLGQLSGGVAHELRNPLGVISNSIYYLNMKLKDKDEKVKKHLALLKREIKRSDNMIIELLDFSKVKLLYITETNVNALIKETIEETKIPEYIDLEMDLDEKIPQIPLDPDKMQKVFQNMISNAIQAMSEKGKLHIKTSSSDDFTEISFSDNGSGITEENLKKIFEPLVTTRAKGIGLGLAIVKDIIDYHKGKIDVKSEVGKGTTFTIKLRNYEIEKL